jgi:hypothetical protein
MANITIKIRVLLKTEDEGRRGTFLGPPPHVKVALRDTVTFEVDPHESTFSVVFVGLSPFEELILTDKHPRSVVKWPGLYHYQVSVTHRKETFRITNCPEIEV